VGRHHHSSCLAYIMDAICSMTPFPLMSWGWTPAEDKPIHVYHEKLWENKAENFAYEIFNWVMVPLHVTRIQEARSIEGPEQSFTNCGLKIFEHEISPTG
jgi:hypothetical protein